jgi:hypothetical protein
MWPASFAKSLSRRLGIASPVFIRSKRNADISGPALTTETTPRPSSPPLLEQSLHTRAIRVCKREPRAIAKYMSVHQNLSRGR